MKKIDPDRLYNTYIQIPYKCTWLEYIKTLHSTVSPLISELQDKKLIEHFHFLVHGGKDEPGLPNTNLEVPRDPGDEFRYIHIRLELAESIECDHKELDDTLEKYECELPKYEGKFQGRITERIGRRRFGGLKYELDGKEFISGEYAWWLLGELSVWVLKMVDVHSLELLADDDWKIFANNVEQYKHFFENQFFMLSKATKTEHLLDGIVFPSRYQ
ncbi:hypothetical protein ACFL6S_24675 [Candidatus Poribacteria bacterium]